MSRAELPAYYTRLAEFRSLFSTGTPILTYHKLGPRPPRVRRKGLYLSTFLFDRQLGELRRAGFASGSLDALPGAVVSARPSVVVTFDDGCASVLDHGLEPLERFGFRAIQFLVAGLLGGTNAWDAERGEVEERLMDQAQVRTWVAAGHSIGAHSMTHPDLTRISPVRAREEIVASKKRLEDLFAVSIDHFCYPFGSWNSQVAEMVLEAGYRTACTTEFGVNTADTPSLALRRITARYRSRSLRSFLRTVLGARA
ncbi:MAG TPA: polysaccharide deacetylase family protein [Candidatus Polarisedimenticolaceae bacterium]|nr:polysaccharide deacetylase family protein [Candidatus Polarisedimenticolaceae bacterium]